MTAPDAVLVYDGDCPYCSIAARALRRLDDVAAVSWYDAAAQAFLSAQFGETPFAMFLVDRAQDRVYGGRSAARELADRAGTPGIVGALVRDNYDRIAAAVGVASGRGRDPDDASEVYPLTDEGRARFDDLLAAADPKPDLLEG
jgi:hypothetical protein